MPVPHPVTETSRIGFITFLWRYFSGQPLIGKSRTNAAWRNRGTSPSHHLNWWTEKPFLHRMIWRWIMVGFPVGWVFALVSSPDIKVNLTVFITLSVMPYVFHHGSIRFIRLLPDRHVVIVRDTVSPDDIHDSDSVRREESDPIQEMFDLDITNDMESHIDVPSKPRKRRGA
jgi:hypothetical protein